jgi:hypothetical protein
MVHQGSIPSARLSKLQFNAIYSSNLLEHWHEDIGGSSSDQAWGKNPDYFAESIARYKQDLRVCSELLKPGGVMLIDVPIHLHGNVLFSADTSKRS